MLVYLHLINNSMVSYGYDRELRVERKGGKEINGKGRVEIGR